MRRAPNGWWRPGTALSIIGPMTVSASAPASVSPSRIVRLRAPMGQVASRAAAALLLCSGAAYLAWSLLPASMRPGDATLISDIAFLPGSLMVAVLAWQAGSRAALSAASRRAWRWIAVGYLLFWLGDAVWFALEIIARASPSPSLADACYLAYYPVMFIGLAIFPRVLRSRTDRARYALDTATVVVGGWMATWFLVIGPVAAAAYAEPLDTLLATAYPIGDLVLLLGVAMVLLRSPSDVPASAITALLAGLLVFLVADTIYAVQALEETYAGGQLVDAINVVAWSLTGVGAYRARWA
jgi:hypothetical protein